MSKILKNRFVLAIFCLILAIVVGFVAVPTVNSIATSTVKVVTVVDKVTVGTQLTAEMLTTVEMGKVGLPEDVILEKQIDKLVGYYAIENIIPGHYITVSVVSNKMESPNAKIRNIEPNERAFAIKLNNATLMRLLPNDIISVYALNKVTGEVAVIPSLAHVTVVAMSTETDEYILTEDQVAANGKPLVADKVLFILNEQQAVDLVEYQEKTSIYFFIEYRGNDEAQRAKYLNEQKNYFKQSATTK